MDRSPIQYTIRSVPPKVDAALRAKAKEEGKSLNDVLIHSLKVVTGSNEDESIEFHDLDWLSKTWVHDESITDALDDQRRLDR